jgi:hypothetical protein
MVVLQLSFWEEWHRLAAWSELDNTVLHLHVRPPGEGECSGEGGLGAAPDEYNGGGKDDRALLDDWGVVVPVGSRTLGGGGKGRTG